jgi:asparagine synthase (glutamine-hydrolysing)
MCGILGYISKKPVIAAQWQSAKDALIHRGPDFQGEAEFKVSGYIIKLAHQRLSIIDLSSGSNQPMTDSFSGLTFNGEIYNYIELVNKYFPDNKNYLQSDTITLFNLIKEIGPLNAARESDGMWAWAFLDIKEGVLTLSKDRFGEKPLYWTFNDNGFYFSSEMKSLLEITNKKYYLNDSEIKLYLEQSSQVTICP